MGEQPQVVTLAGLENVLEHAPIERLQVRYGFPLPRAHV
jgi:hypothetical protein